jgi:hypothetical protein
VRALSTRQNTQRLRSNALFRFRDPDTTPFSLHRLRAVGAA